MLWRSRGGVPLIPQPSHANLPSASYFKDPIKLGNELWRQLGRLPYREGMARARQTGALGEQAGFLERWWCRTEPPGCRARTGLEWLLVTRGQGSPNHRLHSDFQSQLAAGQGLLIRFLLWGRVGTGLSLDQKEKTEPRLQSSLQELRHQNQGPPLNLISLRGK